MEIEKVFFNRKLKYILVYYGPLVNREIKIKDELNFVYKLLNDGKNTRFAYKNTIKHMRSRHGMMGLLQFTSECLKYEKDTIIERFQEMIRVNELLPEKLIENLVKTEAQAIILNRLQTLEEEKFEGIDSG